MFMVTLPRIPVFVSQRRCTYRSTCFGQSSSLAPGPQGAAHVVLGRAPQGSCCPTSCNSHFHEKNMPACYF